MAVVQAFPAAAQDTPPPPPDSAATFTLIGNLFDNLNGQPVVGAVVKVPDLERFAFSNLQGRFAFTDFPAGNWEIIVEQLGYHSTEGVIEVSEGNGLEIYLDPDPVAIEGFRVQSRSQALLSRRRRRIPYAVRTINAEQIANAINPDPTAILRRHARAPMVGCETWDGTWIMGGCVVRKGGRGQVSVYLDEVRMLGGLAEFQLFPASEIHSMDFILRPASGELRVYTWRFIDRLDNSKLSLQPLMW